MERSRFARELFGGIATRYNTPARVLSFGAYGAWRRALVEALALDPSDRVLDVATGTGLIARDAERRYGCAVVGLDVTEAMLRHGERRRVVAGDAQRLPFPDGAFDALTFSYLLRYVEDPAVTLRELSRVVRPGGTVGSVEFCLPANGILRTGWRGVAHGMFAPASATLGPGWARVGAFLPASIEGWMRDWPLERQVGAWEEAGLRGVRVRRMTLGTGVAMIGVRDG